MKSRILCCVMFLVACSAINAYDYNLRVIRDCTGYSEYHGFHTVKIKKGTIISRENIYEDRYNGIICSRFFDYETGTGDTDYTVFYKDSEAYVSVADVELQSCPAKLPEKITDYETKFIPSYFVDVLNSNSRDSIRKYEVIDGYLRKIEYISECLDRNNNFFARVTNVGILLHTFCDEINFTSIEKISDTVYECEGFIIGKPDNAYEDFSWHSINYASTPVGEKETVTLTIDGDYLYIYNKTKGKPITTLVIVDDSVMEGLVDLFKDNKCDLSKVKWPHHADGSTDYDGSRTKKLEGLAPYMRLFVKENLKLRAGEDTSSKVLAVMKPRVEVRILEVGKADTIDGIKSNWVKVDVQFNPRGTGEPLVPSLTGWCFGGYLE